MVVVRGKDVMWQCLATGGCQTLQLLINMLIQLNIKLHSGKIILVAFRSGAFQGTFQYQFQNAWIPPEQVTTGMAILAEPPANFHSSGMHRIPPESPESGRNLWGTDKTSGMPGLHSASCHTRCPRIPLSGVFHPRLGVFVLLCQAASLPPFPSNFGM